MTFRRRLTLVLVVTLPLALLLPAFAQEASPQTEPPPAAVASAPPAARAAQTPRTGWHRFDEPDTVGRPASPRVEHPALPLNVTVPAGTWITLRLDQTLSSDHNYQGDAWTATLAAPVIVSGRVVAQRGQTVGGVVADAEKSSKKTSHVSRLGLDLNELALADGRQLAVKTRLIGLNGSALWNHDPARAGTVVNTGALVTHGKSTVLYPQTQLTFRLETPYSFSIENESSLRAFGPVSTGDYKPQPALQQRVVARPSYYGAYPYYGGYPYYGPGAYWWPSVGVYWGGGWGGGWGYRGGGYRGGGHGR